MKLRLATLALALASASVFAQDASYDADRQYGQEAVLTQVSDGFYARVDANGEAYVATTPAGHRALLQKLLEMRQRSAATAKAAPSGYVRPFSYDDLIAKLSMPQPKNQDVFGDCSGETHNINSPMRVQALAGGNYGASAATSNFTSPVINTTNYATAAVYNVEGTTLQQQSDTKYGATAAVATAYSAARGCTADSRSTITCPGHATPSLTAIASNWRGCTPP